METMLNIQFYLANNKLGFLASFDDMPYKEVMFFKNKLDEYLKELEKKYNSSP